MNINYRQTVLLGFFVLTNVAPGFSEQQAVDTELLREQEERQRKKQEEYRKLYYKLPKLDICGRVIDQYGDPVPDAKVTINWENADELLGKMPKQREEIVKTDSQGCFKLRCDKPVEARAEAEKEGYARLSGIVRNLIRFRDQTPEAVTAVITLRKKGDLTFLLVSEGSAAAWAWMYTNKTGKVSMDLLAKVSNRPRKEKKREDLCADVHYNATNKTWSVVYTGATGDGIIGSDQCLYEAPDTGYTNLVSLTITNDQVSAKCFLYLRSRSPVFYSRVELEHRANTAYPEEGYQFRIYIENICVNPYGERNLEYDERFDKGWRAREEMTKEAVTAISQGRFPEKCKDVPARIKAANERK